MGRRIRVRVDEEYNHCHAVYSFGKLVPEPLESITVSIRKPLLVVEKMGYRMRINDRLVNLDNDSDVFDFFDEIRTMIDAILSNCEEDEKAYFYFHGSPCPNQYHREFLCPKEVIKELREFVKDLERNPDKR